LIKKQIRCDPVGPPARSGSQLICETLEVLILWIKPQSTAAGLILKSYTVIHCEYLLDFLM